jgi:hypothetical protein
MYPAGCVADSTPRNRITIVTSPIAPSFSLRAHAANLGPIYIRIRAHAANLAKGPAQHGSGPACTVDYSRQNNTRWRYFTSGSTPAVEFALLRSKRLEHLQPFEAPRPKSGAI